MIKMSRKAKKAMAVALTAGMLASTAVTPVMAATKGWKQNSKGWWYQNADGSYPANKWSLINGKWYYFDANGYMKANAWVQDKAGKWYFVGADGAMKTNAWAKDKAGLWYWLTGDGSMFEGGWGHINGEYYFFKNDGVMQSGVVKVDGKTYYLGLPSEGWMQTGEINVSGTTYNFDAKSGACTDVKAPAAAKAFDKTGKEIENEVEVEEVAGITGSITNALPDFKEKYDKTNVVIAGKVANFKVLVTDEKGNPVVGTPVTLTYKKSKEVETNGSFEILSTIAPVTDKNGYAYFVIGAKDKTGTKVTPTSGDCALLELTATAVATNQKYETKLSFATINLGNINVINHDDEDDDLLEVPSTNADSTEWEHHIATTRSIDGAAGIEYVATQQVNDKNATNHKVEIEATPTIYIPYEEATTVVDKFQRDVNQEIKEYSVYENNSFKVEKIPAGLKYINLNFSSIDVSAYTQVQIQMYKAGTTDPEGAPYIIEGPITQKNFTKQIPIQDEDVELDVVVKVISEGQVDDNQNSGLFLKDIEGKYSSEVKSNNDRDSYGTVTWSVVENKYSEEKVLSDTDAAKYIPNDPDMKKYKSDKYTYTYVVPAFPYTGNAIMTVKDENKKVVGYFTIPTTNTTKGTGTWQNENIIIDTTAGQNKAILVSYDEAFGKTGTIEQSGNKVIVNSETTGITALEAKINIPGFEDQINVINNTLYTSVQWSPIPAEQSIDSDDFYALVGQNINVKAQLVDKNGNKVSQAGEEITFKYTNDSSIDEIDKMGEVPGTKASVTNFRAETDANGQAVLSLSSPDDLALVEKLHAESGKYAVQLTIGDTTVNNANLRWVEAGLSFTDSTVNPEHKIPTPETIDTLDRTVPGSVLVGQTNNGYLVKDAGTNWILGYEVVGQTENKVDFKVTGLDVKVTKSGKGDLATTGMANGTAKVTSKETGITTLTGTINEKSVVKSSDVEFHIGDDVYKNVGEGESSINASLNLPINWGNVGAAVSIFNPKGTKIKWETGDKAYVQVTDENGNVKADQNVEVRVVYTLSDGTKTTTLETDVDGNENRLNADDFFDETPDNATGLVEVNLKDEINGKTVKSAVITAKLGNVDPAKYTIQYVDENKVTPTFEIGDIAYEEQTDTSNPKIRVIFTTPVNAETLKKEMFTVSDGTYNLNVAKAEVVGGEQQNEVVLTLSNTHQAGLDYKEEYIVTVKPYTEKRGSINIVYKLTDTYFNTITSDSDTFTTADTDLAAARKAASVAMEASLKANQDNADVLADVDAVKKVVNDAVDADPQTTLLDFSGIANVQETKDATGDSGLITLGTKTATIAPASYLTGGTFKVVVKKGDTTKTVIVTIGGSTTAYTANFNVE